MIATARFLMPASMVRLSAGRRSLSREAVALCFVAGSNSLSSQKMLTTPNPEPEDDALLLHSLVSNHCSSVNEDVVKMDRRILAETC